jgi:hypothetical protein
MSISKEDCEPNQSFLLYVQTTNSLPYVLEGMMVRVHGDTPIVTGLYTLKGGARGRPFVERGRFVDAWLLKSGQWVTIASLSAPDR